MKDGRATPPPAGGRLTPLSGSQPPATAATTALGVVPSSLLTEIKDGPVIVNPDRFKKVQPSQLRNVSSSAAAAVALLTSAGGGRKGSDVGNEGGNRASIVRSSFLNGGTSESRIKDLAFLYDVTDEAAAKDVANANNAIDMDPSQSPDLPEFPDMLGLSAKGKFGNLVSVAKRRMLDAPAGFRRGKHMPVTPLGKPPPIEQNMFDTCGPGELTIVKPVDREEEDSLGALTSVRGSFRPTSRKDVVLLRGAMDSLLDDLGIENEENGPAYPSDLHGLLSVIQEEQKTYDMVFQEIIRQVTVQMRERGEILADIRERYARMFTRVPRHIRNLHTELVAHRRLNRRLAEELFRTKDNVAVLLRELESVRSHDSEVTRQANEMQQRFVNILTQPENNDNIMEEYHKLYRMQRERLEDNLRSLEKEKAVWIDAALDLTLRVGQEHGNDDVPEIQRIETGRLRGANHLILTISETNDRDLKNVERQLNSWRTTILLLSRGVVQEDQENIETLSIILREMRIVSRLLDAGDPVVGSSTSLAGEVVHLVNPSQQQPPHASSDAGSSHDHSSRPFTPLPNHSPGSSHPGSPTKSQRHSAAHGARHKRTGSMLSAHSSAGNSHALLGGNQHRDHRGQHQGPSDDWDQAPILRAFQESDVQAIRVSLQRWVGYSSQVSTRFTSDRDLTLQEEVQQLRKTADKWVEDARKLLARNEATTNGKDYTEQMEVLRKLTRQIEEWLSKLENRVAGEDGIASGVIMLQNQLEDRSTAFNSRDMTRPVSNSERFHLRESLESWTNQIVHIIATLSMSMKKEQTVIPQAVDTWLNRILDQLTTDSEVRVEENQKIHNTIVSWLVHLLVKSGKEKPDDSWDIDLHQLTQELRSMNSNLLKDSIGVEMISDDGSDLRTVIMSHAEEFIVVSKRLLYKEKFLAEKIYYRNRDKDRISEKFNQEFLKYRIRIENPLETMDALKAQAGVEEVKAPENVEQMAAHAAAAVANSTGPSSRISSAKPAQLAQATSHGAAPSSAHSHAGPSRPAPSSSGAA